MLDNFANRVLALAPGLLPGEMLHRRALAATAAARYVDAERLFEAAAAAYRCELRMEPLARLRVHQLMARARSGDRTQEAERLLEIVRGLNKLDQLESFAPPFELHDAREVLADWLGAAQVADAEGAEPGQELSAAA